ncbi:MAG: murein biosynthesis integral membrane protein MurJ [Desulfobacteraceae bacterium]|jgi:putative peptidoglycan lipid II flippase
MSQSLYKKVGIAAAIMMGSIFLSRFFGFFRLMVIAYVGGRSADVDAYQVAFVLPEILNHMVASGFLSITFIPIFSRYLAENREDEGWDVFSIISCGFGSLLLMFIVCSVFFTPELVALIARGRPDTVFRENVITMTRIIIPAQFFFFTGGLFMAVQFAKEKFWIPALAPLIYNLGIIAGGVFLSDRLGMQGFSWGVLFGSFVGNFALQWWGAKKVGMKFSINFNFKHPELKTYVKKTLPLMFGLTMFFSMEIFMKFFGSYLPPGSIADLEYSFRTMLLLVAFFGQAVGVASYPFMARLVAENKLQEMNQLLNNTLKYLSLVIPASVLLMVLRRDVILIIFQRGKFDASATEHTSLVLVYLLIGAFAVAANTVVPRAYYAMQDTLFPAIYGTVAVLISVPFYLMGLKLMNTEGVALAVSLSAILQVVVLYALWNKRSHNQGSKGVYRLYLKIIVFSVLMGIVLVWFRSVVLAGIDATTIGGSFLAVVLSSALFLIVLLVAGYGLKISQIDELIRKIINKLKLTKS